MNSSVLKRLLTYLKPYTVLLIIAFISAILNITLTLLSPILIGDAVDLLIGPNNVDFHSVLRILIFLSLAIIFAALAQLLMTRCTNIITYKTVRDLRVQAFNKINSVPLKYIDGNPHGDIISRVITDIDQISDGLLQGFSQLFTGVITIVGTILFMFSINITITLVVVLVTPLSLFVAAFITRHSHAMFKKQSELRGEMAGYIEEIIGNQREVKAFSFEDRAKENFEKINERLYDCGFKAQFYAALANPSTRFVNGIVYASVGIIGAISAIHGNLTIGGISSFLAYANQYTKPFNEISGVVTEFQAAFASASRVFEVLDEKEERADNTDALTITNCSGKIDIN